MIESLQNAVGQFFAYVPQLIGAIVILITPAAPAAACVWPRFDLIEPTRSDTSLAT